LFLHADIFDSFLDKLKAKTQALTLGDPLDENSDIGAIINEKQFRKVCGYVDDGLKRKDARLVFGGLPPTDGPLSEGYFAIPTVFADTSNDWRLAREEIFGPVLVAIPWRDEDEAIRMANDSHYGLAAYVWTHEIGSGLRAAHSIEPGWVQVNQGLGQQPGHSYGGYKLKRDWPRIFPGRHAGQLHAAQECHGQFERAAPLDNDDMPLVTRRRVSCLQGPVPPRLADDPRTRVIAPQTTCSACREPDSGRYAMGRFRRRRASDGVGRHRESQATDTGRPD
jgi:hypothetical protein